MPSTDFSAQQLATGIGSQHGPSDPAEAQQLATNLGSQRAGADAIGAEQLFSEGDPGVSLFKMRGIDSGAWLTTWIAKGVPDPDGLQATPANTTPALTGSIIAGTGIILATWSTHSND